MGRELVVLWAGRHRRDAWEDLCSDYRKRIARWTEIRDHPVRVPGSGDDERRRRLEGEALLQAAPDPAWGIALDSGGKTYSSEAFSRYLARVRREWPHSVAFFLGSDLGLGEEVLGQARLVLSFGPMTLPHELARLVLYEQVYRALSISKGINYHRPRF